MKKLAFDIGVIMGMEKTALKVETVGRAMAKRIRQGVKSKGIRLQTPHGAEEGARVAERLAKRKPGYERYLKKNPEAFTRGVASTHPTKKMRDQAMAVARTMKD